MATSINYDYASIPPGYYDTIHARGKGVQSKWHHLKFARVRKELGHFTRHLDIGCGPGTFVGSLEGPGFSLGVDVAEPQVQYALKTHGSERCNFSLMEPGRLPAPDGSVDVVTMIELIEHLSLDEDRELLAEVYRVLQPGGRVVLTTPNYAAFWPILEYLVNRFGRVKYIDQHISRFRLGSLRALVETAGFRVELAETYLFAGPFAAALGWKMADWVERLEPVWFRRRFGHLLLVRAVKPEKGILHARRVA